MLQETTKIIGEMTQWKDAWNFDSWAANYDTDVLNPESKGLKFYENYDKVLERTAKEAGSIRGFIVEIGLGTGNLTKKIVDKELISLELINLLIC